MQDDGCRFIANLTSISKLGAGRVGSVRLMALHDGTSAALKQDFPGKDRQADFHREVRPCSPQWTRSACSRTTSSHNT